MPTRAHWFGLAAALMLAGVPCQAAETSIIAIVGATVIHPDRNLPSAVAANSMLIIAGRRIESIGPAGSTAVPAGATRIDGKGKWVVPGLIDSHVHFFQSGNLYTRPDVADFNAWMPYAKEVERNKRRLAATFKVWLASGVTSVVDIGGPFWNFEMRDAALKSPAAPRVAVAGPLLSMVERGFPGALGGGCGGGRGIPCPGEKEPRALLPDALREAGLPLCAVEYLAADRSRAAPGRSADPRRDERFAENSEGDASRAGGQSHEPADITQALGHRAAEPAQGMGCGDSCGHGNRCRQHRHLARAIGVSRNGNHDPGWADAIAGIAIRDVKWGKSDGHGARHRHACSREARGPGDPRCGPVGRCDEPQQNPPGDQGRQAGCARC